MNGDRLLGEFDRLCDAPDAVKRLRRLLVDLAIRGQLFDDTGATNGKRRADRDPGSSPAPFNIPARWDWVCINDLEPEFQNGASSRGAASGEPRIVLRLADVKDGSISLADTREIVMDKANFTKYSLANDDLLVIRVNGSGDLVGRFIHCNLNTNVAYCDHFIRLRTCGDRAHPEYLALVGNSPFVRMQIDAKFVTTAGQKTINQKHLGSILLPLPPLAEQEHIVAKVDELMAVCDELETAQEQRERRRKQLSAASLARLTAAAGDTPSRVAEKDVAFYLSHSSRMVTRPAHVADVRRTILHLAVQGRLTRQLETDTHAQHLLREAAAVSMPSRVESTPAIDGLPSFEDALPSTWSWCTVGQIASKVTDGEHLTPQRSTSGYWLLSARNVTDRGIDLSNVDYVDREEFLRIRRRCDPNRGDVLISCSGSVGRVAVVDRDDAYVMVRSAAMIRPFVRTLTPYLALALKSPVLQAQISARSKATAQANLFLGAIKGLHLPLPPLQEQDRIVDKVNELMAVCDELERSLEAAQAGRTRAMEAVLHRVLDEASAPLPELLEVVG